MRKQAKLFFVCVVFALCGFSFLALDRIFPFPLHALEPRPSVRVLDRTSQPLRFFLAPDGMWRFPVELKDVSPELIAAIIASEDRYFYHHFGVNPLAALRAAWHNVRSGRVVSGASTIPMQVARLASPAPRTLGAKVVEAFRAIQLSTHYSKEQILIWYLNLAPFGSNVVGVGAASWYYFDKPPHLLSLGEIALLSVLPRSPTRYNPLKNPQTARMVRDNVLRRFAMARIFDKDRIAHSLGQPLLASRTTPPCIAPHFSQWARSRADSKGVLVSSIDKDMQSVVEKLLTAHMKSLRRAAIGNAAVVVLNLSSREVLAHVGSADFWDADRQGQVDNTLSRRSPGSALKPFLYALAFDQGHLVPGSMLLDVPTDFAGYRPENYNQSFQGLVCARTALAASLNVPAVRLLARCGQPAFFSLLEQGGLTTLDHPPGHYGLALALGGCDVRLMELTNLYATLGAGGLYRSVRPVRLGPGERLEGDPLFSPESCALVLSVLGTVRRPNLPDAWEATLNAPAVAWKTGTSFGHRDAWAVGLGQDLAIGVWVGNPDGTQCKDISGVRHAGPLLFDLFRALRPGARLPQVPAPRLVSIPICAISGDKPGPFCPAIRTSAIAGITRLTSCTMHKQIFVDQDNGLRLFGDCLLNHPSQMETVVVWPAELLAWRRAGGMADESLPAMHPDCVDVPDESGPVISSPSPDTPYVLRPEAPSEFQHLALLAAPRPGASVHYWYVDSVFVGKSAPDAPCFVQPEPGSHRVSVTDDLGRGSSVVFTVRAGRSAQ